MGKAVTETNFLTMNASESRLREDYIRHISSYLAWMWVLIEIKPHRGWWGQFQNVTTAKVFLVLNEESLSLVSFESSHSVCVCGLTWLSDSSFLL